MASILDSKQSKCNSYKNPVESDLTGIMAFCASHHSMGTLLESTQYHFYSAKTVMEMQLLFSAFLNLDD